MRAVIVREFGGPEVLELTEAPEPSARPGQVLIRPRYVSVNFADVKARRGGHHTTGTPPFIPGLDVAGEVVAVGEGVTGLAPGELVAAATDGGAYAEVVTARAELCFPLTRGADLRKAAGVVVLMTAYNVVLGKGHLQEGESVLVHGAAGGVGSVVLQLARRSGAGRIVGVVGSEEKVAVALENGAHEVAVGRGPEVLRSLSGEFDLILDPVAGEGLAAELELLAPFGRIVVYGNADGHGTVSSGPLHSGNRTVIGYSSGHYRKHRPDEVRGAAAQMFRLLDAGEIVVPIGRTYPLADAAQAHRHLESRSSTGKLLLEP
ncbi:MAG TPA: zinc-binding dehydrogenase [Trueperaceae bacterium]